MSGAPLLPPVIGSVAPALRPPDRHRLPFWVEKIVMPLLAVVPPIILALITHDLSTLVSITGSYAGAFVQYLIPAALIFFGRKRLAYLVRLSPSLAPVTHQNPHRSPFGNIFWICLVCLWAVVSIGLVTVDHILTGK